MRQFATFPPAATAAENWDRIVDIIIRCGMGQSDVIREVRENALDRVRMNASEENTRGWTLQRQSFF